MIGLISKIIKLAILILIIFIIYNFYQIYSTQKENGVSPSQAANMATVDTFKKITPVFEGIYDFGKYAWDNFIKEKVVIKSDSQNLFIEARGNPDFFIKIFSWQNIDNNGFIEDRRKTRVIEYWYYSAPYNKLETFDNGFFEKEEELENLEIDYVNKISPVSITKETQLKDVLILMGEPDCETSVQSGDNTLKTIRYNRTDKQPESAFTFSDEKIISATVGIVFNGEENKICN